MADRPKRGGLFIAAAVVLIVAFIAAAPRFVAWQGETVPPVADVKPPAKPEPITSTPRRKAPLPPVRDPWRGLRHAPLPR